MYVTNYYICISNSDISWNFNSLSAISTCLTGISNLRCSKRHPQFPAPTFFPIAVHGNSIFPVAQVKNPWNYSIIDSSLFLTLSIYSYQQVLSALPSKYQYIQNLPLLSLPQLTP